MRILVTAAHMRRAGAMLCNAIVHAVMIHISQYPQSIVEME